MLWQWGQILDHDVSHTPAGEAGNSPPISVPPGTSHSTDMATGSGSRMTLTSCPYMNISRNCGPQLWLM